MVLGKFKFLMKIISANGGPFKSFYKLWRMDTCKIGKLRGIDSYGNKYYENDYYQLSRNRWVEHNIAVRWNYDATQVTPEWYGWLHYKTDRIPSEDCAKIEIAKCDAYKAWLQPHEENLTGTDRAYYPYSTTRPKINAWNPPVVCKPSSKANAKSGKCP